MNHVEGVPVSAGGEIWTSFRVPGSVPQHQEPVQVAVGDDHPETEPGSDADHRRQEDLSLSHRGLCPGFRQGTDHQDAQSNRHVKKDHYS